MKFTATLAIILISYGILLQSLHSSEVIVFFFVCQCNHDSVSEVHEANIKNRNHELSTLPDCHKKEKIPHVCSCKNGSILKKMNDFLAQFNYLQVTSGMNRITFCCATKIIDLDNLFLRDPFPFPLERPPNYS